MNTSRFIVGLVLIAVAVGVFLLGREYYATAGAVGFGVLGLVTIAISRKNQVAEK